ncbi:MAG: serpin family protein [Asgard group archaeon]|nr:serpin family protein [Asgard group archaeon]
MVYSRDLSITQASNKFAFELYNKLIKNKTNLFFSPFSISTALAMVYVGAKDETAKQIEEVMHFTLNKKRLAVEYEKFIGNFNQERASNKAELMLSNAQWFNLEFKLLEDYIYTIETHFKGMLSEVDFKDEENTLEIINSWVQKNTKGKIAKILDEINPDTMLLITNAIYFKDKWLKPFDEKKTKEEPFYITKEKKVLVDMMHEKQNYSFRNYPNYQILKIPYRDPDLSLVIFLPRDIEGLVNLEKKLLTSDLDTIINDIQSQEVEIFIPKFILKDAMKLSKEFQEMGMKEPFSTRADFGGMSETQLAISEVVHKSFIEVNEEGTEAAAATAVEMVLGYGFAEKKEKNIFRADHPFLFMIYSYKTNLILFMGRMVNPKVD